ncbi:MAG TPA: hypothetical protein VG496_05165 [Myxococcales bacterium]|nr:hypothetical protein [Myxococcales bacterium]
MSPAVQIALLFVFAAMCLAMLWRAPWVPATVAAAELRRQQRPPNPEDPGDEQQPETDRAPRRMSHLLTYAVALTAAVRVGFLVALHR